MRITIVLNTAWNLYNFRRGLIDALQSAGHTVTLIAPEDAYARLLRQQGYRLVAVNMDRRGINPWHDMKFFLRMYRVYRELRPDMTLHFTVKPNIYGTMAASLLGVRMINTVSGLGTVFLKKGVSSWVAQQLYRLTFRWPQRVFFHNHSDYQLFVEQKLVTARQAEVVPGSGVNVTHFAPVSSKPTASFTFLVVARLLYDKGVMEYAEAARLLQKRGLSVRCQLLGARDPQHRRGVTDAQVDAWVSEGLIEYLGTTDDVRPCMAQADAVVLPSYREGLPRTLLEAASMEKPIIATDVPGCRHVVTHEQNGLLCQVRDAVDLADKMERLVNMPAQERHAMGQAGRRKAVAQFSEARVIEHYLSASQTLLTDHTPALSKPTSP